MLCTTHTDEETIHFTFHGTFGRISIRLFLVEPLRGRGGYVQYLRDDPKGNLCSEISSYA